MSPEPKSGSNPFWQKLVMPEEDKRAYPSAPQWDGGYRWFRSTNVIDLQRYRSPAEKERIRVVLLRLGRPFFLRINFRCTLARFSERRFYNHAAKARVWRCWPTPVGRPYPP